MADRVTIRAFEQADLDDVVSLLHRTIDISYKDCYSAACIEHYKQYHSAENVITDSTEGYTVVLIQNEKIVGVGAVVKNYIRRVYIDPDCHGSGFGSMIMDHLENKIKQDGYSEIDLAASTPAIDFYLKLGYEVIEETYVEFDDDNLHYYEMKKKV